jgi:hypothetical protein
MVIENEIVEQVHTFERLRSYVSYFGEVGLDIN